MTKIAMTSHGLSPLSGEPGSLERVGLLEGDASAEKVVVAYHERIKHHVHRYASSLGYMDWATQPDPFRRYSGADIVRPPLPETGRPLPNVHCSSLKRLAKPAIVFAKPLAVQAV